MSDAPLSRGIGTGAAQVLDFSGVVQADAANQERLRKQQAEEDEKAELAAKEARGEVNDLADRQYWSFRDGEVLMDTYNSILDKYVGRYGEMHKNPKLKAEFDKELGAFIAKTKASKEDMDTWNGYDAMFNNPEWKKHRSEEQYQEHLSVTRQPGFKMTPEFRKRVYTPTQNLGDPLVRIKTILPYEAHLTSDDNRWGAASGASGGDGETFLNVDGYMSAIDDRLESNELFRAEAEKVYGSMDDPENVQKLKDAAVRQYTKTTKHHSYFDPPEKKNDEQPVNEQLYDERNALPFATAFEDLGFGTNYFDPRLVKKYKNFKVTGVATTGGYKEDSVDLSLGGWRRVNVGYGGDDKLTGEEALNIGNVKRIKVNEKGQLDSKGDYKWVIFANTGKQDGTGKGSVYTTVDNYVASHPNQKIKARYYKYTTAGAGRNLNPSEQENQNQ